MDHLVRGRWIALALNIRPGAMFVLPALLLWGGWIFRGQGKFSYKFFLWGSAIILFVFYANNKMIDFVAGPSGVAFENFSWAFYGLAAGGRSWRYVFEAQPNAKDSAEIYRLAFELIRNNPSLIISGALFYWKMFFSSTWYNAYAFVAGENYLVNEIARWGMYILSALGIFKWFRNFRDATASLAVLGALGVLASVPFVPPTDAYRVRLYAATIPFFILLPGMGLSFLQEKMPVNFLKPHLKSTPGNFPLTTISGISCRSHPRCSDIHKNDRRASHPARNCLPAQYRYLLCKLRQRHLDQYPPGKRSIPRLDARLSHQRLPPQCAQPP
ncbi:MAG: hypothetical protein IPJ31_11960 [Bacteroidetes bacterium]|nr:hypothetical protein [Bacteroidota bacterium]